MNWPHSILIAALKPGAPLEGWLPSMNHFSPEERVQVVLRSRFNYWKQEWSTRRQRLGPDGHPPVQKIFDLA